MKIKRLKIHNWRSIKDVDIVFDDLMVFIGQNNHGKSNVLSALLFFFGLINCTELDFNNGENEVFVEVTFANLDSHDQAQFGKYVTASGTMTVRKLILKGDSFEYHGYCEIPMDDWLKEDKLSEYSSRDAIGQTPLNPLVSATGRITKDMVKQAQEAYIATNKDRIQFSYSLERTNFLGLKSVAQGIFGEVFFVPAVKNALEEFNVKGKSVFNQLLTNVINDMSVSNPEYIDAKKKVRELTQILNKTIDDGSPNANRPEQISKLENLLETELASWNTTIDIEITPPDVDEVLRVGTNVRINDGVTTDVGRKGNGLQRSLIFALIKAWAKVSQETRDRVVANGDSQRKASKSTYFIFEEPELYLHPQAQRELYDSLKKLSQTSNQVLLSTHSSAFVDLDQYKSICIIYKKDISEGTKHRQCTADLFGSIDEKKKFNMTYWINPDRGELFFARKIILVEGPTDKTVIPYLAKQLNVFRYDYSIIDCGCKDNMQIYIHLLNNFGLSYIAVYDKDHQSYKKSDGISSADIASGAIENSLNRKYGSSIIMENDIEEEIGLTSEQEKHKAALALDHISAPGFAITATLRQKIQAIFN